MIKPSLCFWRESPFKFLSLLIGEKYATGKNKQTNKHGHGANETSVQLIGFYSPFLFLSEHL